MHLPARERPSPEGVVSVTRRGGVNSPGKFCNFRQRYRHAPAWLTDLVDLSSPVVDKGAPTKRARHAQKDAEGCLQYCLSTNSLAR